MAEVLSDESAFKTSSYDSLVLAGINPSFINGHHNEPFNHLFCGSCGRGQPPLVYVNDF